MSSVDKPDYGYALQPVKRLAQCPWCARMVEFVEGGQVIGACPPSKPQNVSDRKSMPDSLRIEVSLPADRTRTGILRVIDDRAAVLFSCPVLGKSDNAMATAKGNLSRNPLLPFGDTPLGFWKATIGPKFTKPEDVRTYGPHRVIMLRALDGAALIAEQQGKRSGIWSHGGALGWGGRLRPTYGCIRKADEHQAAILAILDPYFATLPIAQRWCIYETKAA